MSNRPTSLKILDNEIRLTWSDGHESIYWHKFLREKCPCAGCGGEPGLFGKMYVPPPLNVPDDIKALKFWQVGRYAVSFVWSDGHQTGIYTFEYLRQLCQCGQCKAGAQNQV